MTTKSKAYAFASTNTDPQKALGITSPQTIETWLKAKPRKFWWRQTE